MCSKDLTYYLYLLWGHEVKNIWVNTLVANNRITTNVHTKAMTMEQWHKNIHMTKLTKNKGHKSYLSFIINLYPANVDFWASS
jgi:hypothetical protein